MTIDLLEPSHFAPSYRPSAARSSQNPPFHSEPYGSEKKGSGVLVLCRTLKKRLPTPFIFFRGYEWSRGRRPRTIPSVAAASDAGPSPPSGRSAVRTPCMATTSGAGARRRPAARIAHSESPLATGKRPSISDTRRPPGIGPETPSRTWDNRAGPPRHTTHGVVRSQPDRQYPHYS